MKFVNVLLAAILILSVNGFADESQQDSFQPRWYGDFHLGKTNTSLIQAPQDFSFLSIGGVYGYRFAANFSWEFFASFATNGKRDDIFSAILGQEVKAKYDAFGFYITSQTTGDFYVKAKAGIAFSMFSYTAGGYEDETERDIGLSYGIGVGARSDDIVFELNYMVMPEVDDPLFSNYSYDSDMLLFSIGRSFN